MKSPPNSRRRHFLLRVLISVSLLYCAHTGLVQVDALYPYKLIKNDSQEILLSPEEWTSEFQCNLPDAREAEQNGTLPLDCYRDPNVWLFKHIEEIHDEFKVLVRQSSFDERAADKIYAVNLNTGLDLHHYIINSGDAKRDRLLEEYAAGPQVDNKLCKRHLKQMVALLGDMGSRVDRKRRSGNPSANDTTLDERHFRLARVLDSFGRHESGVLNGRYHSFGVYHQCVRTPLLLGDAGGAGGGSGGGEQLVDSRYCWARLNLDRHLSRPLRERGVMKLTWGDYKFHLATCLPATCHTKSFSQDKENLALVQTLIDSQLEMPTSMYLNQSRPIDSVFCLVDPNSKVGRWSMSAISFVAFLVGWVLLCSLATYRRWNKHNQISDGKAGQQGVKDRRKKSFWYHIDLYESYWEFVGQRAPRHSKLRVDLDPLNFIKCLCTLLVTVVHACLISSPLSISQLQMQATMETGRYESMALFGFVLVDTFFIITSTIITYISLKKFAALERSHQEELVAASQLPATITSKRVESIDFEHQFSPLSTRFWKYWMLFTSGRYLRLVPMFFLAFWFKKGLFSYLASGPVWDYGLNKDTALGSCKRESWLTPFTPLSAYLPSPQTCVPQSWSISNDLMFALFLPPLTILLFKHLKLAFLYALCVYTINMYLGYHIFYDLDARLRFEIEQIRNHSTVMLFELASYAYTAPCYRAPALLFGALAGYILFKWDKKCEQLEDGQELAGGSTNKMSVRSKVWPWWFRWPATLVAFVGGFTIFALCVFGPELRKTYTRETRHFFVMFLVNYYHTIWSILNIVVLMRMVTDWQDHPIMRISASRFFKVASKLSYGILLIHWDILIYDSFVQYEANEFSRWNYMKNMSTTYIYSIILSGCVYIAFENPIDKLTRTYVLGI